jgi:quinol monooxygenase YgiN
MPENLFVFAKISPKPEFFDDARTAIEGIIDSTREEPGCFQFCLHAGLEDGALYLYEEWEDDQALSAHYDMPYTKQVFTAYESWLATPPEITKLRRLS